MIDDWYDKLDKFHPYPAKFPLKIATEHIERYTEVGDTVYDPFVGSGTTLIASSLLGRYSFGPDIHHIAVLIYHFKTSYYSEDDLEKLTVFYEQLKGGNAPDNKHLTPLCWDDCVKI